MILLRSILKSHISATSYVNEHGTAVNRREHEDSRTSALEGLRSHPDHRVRSYASKILGSKDSYDLHQIRKERFGHLPHWNKLDEHTRHAIVDAEEEKAKSHKEFEEWVETHGSKKGKKKDSVKVDRSGWEQQLMFKARRVQHVAYILRKSHIPTEVVTNESGTTFVRQEHEDKRDMFIRTASGSVRFGTVSVQTAKEANIAPGPIMLKHGEHTGPHKGYGRKHIDAEHGKEIAAAGFNSPEDFVQYVATNFNAIYPAKKGRIALVVEGPPQQVAIVELKKNKKGGFYSVYTAYPPKKPKFTGTALWRSRQPSQSASGVQPSLHVGQNAHPVVVTQSLSYPTSTSDQNASSKTNLSLPENKFNKSHNPLHLIRRRGC